jgi:tetratricopeptide (TPR) repeat protein
MDNKPKSKHKKKIIIGIILLSIIILGIFAWFYLTQQKKADNTYDGNLSQTDVMSQVEVLNSKKQYDEAKKLIEAQGDYKDGTFNTILYAQNMADTGDVDGAVKFLSDIGKDKPNAYSFKAQEAMLLSYAGRKTEAIAKYKEAIALAESYHPTVAQEDEDRITAIGDYDFYIKDLETNNG